MNRADATAVLPYLPDTALLVLSSMDVYRAYERLLDGQGGEPVPLTEQAPVLTPDLGQVPPPGAARETLTRGLTARSWRNCALSPARAGTA